MVSAEKQNSEEVASRETLRHNSTCRHVNDLHSRRCAGNPTSTYLESALGGAVRFCYSLRTNGDEQQGGPRAGTRPRAERGRRAEHDRDRGDWTVRGQLASDPRDGRPASAERRAGRGAAGATGWVRVVRAGRGG